MLKKLKERYNLGNKEPFRKKIKLPVSETVIRLTLHDPGAAIQSLLTDPRIKDADYFFFDDDPLAPPPGKATVVSELKTGSAFRDTYKVLNIDPKKKEQLLPIPLYMDGSAITHFHNMEIIPIKMSLGFLNRETRNKEHAWRVLGYVEKVHEQGGRGGEMWRKAKHMEVEDDVASDELDTVVIWR